MRLYIFIFAIVLSFSSCEKVEEVRFTQEEVDLKIDSLIVAYKQTIEHEYKDNYDKRRPIEIKQRVQRIIEEKRSKKDDPDFEEPELFTDTVRLSDGNR